MTLSSPCLRVVGDEELTGTLFAFVFFFVRSVAVFCRLVISRCCRVVTVVVVMSSSGCVAYGGFLRAAVFASLSRSLSLTQCCRCWDLASVYLRSCDRYTGRKLAWNFFAHQTQCLRAPSNGVFYKEKRKTHRIERMWKLWTCLAIPRNWDGRCEVLRNGHAKGERPPPNHVSALYATSITELPHCQIVDAKTRRRTVSVTNADRKSGVAHKMTGSTRWGDLSSEQPQHSNSWGGIRREIQLRWRQKKRMKKTRAPVEVEKSDAGEVERF